MTDPRDPGDDWGFPEVDPASTQLPPEPDEEPVYDTGSDAWWRAQAEAQRRAAAGEPVVPPAPPAAPAPEPPPPLVEPTVLNQPSPLDSGWVPPELPELHPAAPEEPAPEEPAPEEPAPEEPAEPAAAEPAPEEPAPEEPAEPAAVEVADEVAWDDSPHDDGDAWDDATTAYAAPATADGQVEDEHPAEPQQDWFRGLVDTGSAEAVAEDMPYETPPAGADPAGPRPPYEGERVSAGRAVLGAGIALLGVLLAIGALVVFNGNSEPKGGPTVAPPSPAAVTPTSEVTSKPTPTVSASPPAVVTTTPPAVAAPIVQVRVLNNSKIKGLADRAAARFRAGGWPVPQTGNYRGGNIATTTVYYPPGEQASAERFAKQFGIPRVAPRFAGIPVPGMTVIVTRDYHP